MSSSTEVSAATRGAVGKAARRTRVVQAAMKLAAEGGYDAVQMREVAERANVSLGTIYRYFNGKDDMLVSGLAGWVQLLREELDPALFDNESPAERLADVLGYAAAAAEVSPVLMSALVTALATTDPQAIKYKRLIDAEVGKMVVQAIGDEPGIDVAGVSRVVGHVWLAAITRWVGGLAEAGSVEAELRHAVHMMLSDTRD
jgi:AcrR family transcriptional regulator